MLGYLMGAYPSSLNRTGASLRWLVILSLPLAPTLQDAHLCEAGYGSQATQLDAVLLEGIEPVCPSLRGTSVTLT